MSAPQPAVELATLSHAVVEAESLDELARPLLDVLRRATGLDSVYLTAVDWERGQERIVISDNAGEIQIEEGLTVPWDESLCSRALADGRHYTDDVRGTWPDNGVARDLGIKTYAMAPVTTAEGEVFGTLCGVSGSTVSVDEAIQEMMTLFARLIADHLVRERATAEHRSRADAAEERLRDRARFLAAAEHQLKTPLTTILGWSSLLRHRWDQLSEEDRVDAVSVMVDASETLRRQLDRLLDEARAEIIAGDLDLVVADVSELVKAIAHEFSHASAGHPLVAELLEPALARVDRAAVHQVLGHLIENAIKYSPEGGPIRLSVRRGPADVAVQVADRGVGIPDDVDVFAPFTRGHHDAPGIGLGLHIVRSLVDALGGTVEARRNADGPGSTFEVVLPAVG